MTLRSVGARLGMASIASLLVVLMVAPPAAQAAPSPVNVLTGCLNQGGALPQLPATHFVIAIAPEPVLCPATSRDAFNNRRVGYINGPWEAEVCTTLTLEARGQAGQVFTPPAGWHVEAEFFFLPCDRQHRLTGPNNAAKLKCDVCGPSPDAKPHITEVENDASYGKSAELRIGEHRDGIAIESSSTIIGTNLSEVPQKVTTMLDPQETCQEVLANRSIEVRSFDYDNDHQAQVGCITSVSQTRIDFFLPHAANQFRTHTDRPGKILIKDTTKNQYLTLDTGSITRDVPIRGFTPGLFSRSLDGQGVPNGYVLRVRPDGSQSIEDIGAAISLGPDGDQVHLVLYGTGIRLHSSDKPVFVGVGGTVRDGRYSMDGGGKYLLSQYAGPASGYDRKGVDQVNVLLPRDVQRGSSVFVRIFCDDTSQVPSYLRWSNVLGVNII